MDELMKDLRFGVRTLMKTSRLHARRDPHARPRHRRQHRLTGITGVIATSVSQRMQEFGVRMALDASRETVLAMVLRQGLLLVLLGLAVGVAGAVALTRVLSSYLFATAPTARPPLPSSSSRSW